MSDKYSQNDEELFIVDYFKDEPIGKFLDIGAYDVFRFSNTRKLYEIGWSGILVEPAPQNYAAIGEHYKDEPRIELLNVAVGEPAGEIDFYESDGDAVGTTDEQHMIKWNSAGVKFTKIRVPQIGVVDFFEKHGRGIDFLSIDTEATNITVFRNIPDWVWGRVKMICIEHDGCIEEIEEKLFNFGFFVHYVNGENIILAK
jgi:FkbM family methyltransferase